MTGDITVGIDPHRKVFTAAALDERGRLLAHEHFDNNHDGRAAVLVWAREFGAVDRFGVEGASGLGRPLSEYLVAHSVDVREVPPHKTSLRQRGDTKARATGSMRTGSRPRPRPTTPWHTPSSSPSPLHQTRFGDQIALWHGARTSLRTIRVQLIGELDALIQALPEELQAQLPVRATVRARINAVDLLDAENITDPVHRLRVDMIRQRTQMLREVVQVQDKAAQAELDKVIAQTGTTFPRIPGIAARAAAEILLEVGDVRRFTEPGFARYNGTAPSQPVLAKPADDPSGTDSTAAATVA